MIERQFCVREVFFCILLHSWYASGVSGVDIDVFDFVTAFHHVLQHTQAGFTFAEIVVQADLANSVDVAKQERTFFVGSKAVVLFAVLGQGSSIV